MPSRYDRDIKAKATRLVQDHAGDYDSKWAAICQIAGRLGMSAETLRKWVQAEVDAGQTPGVPTGTAWEIRELKRKNAELERTIEILKAATSFFVRERDRYAADLPVHRRI